MALLLSDKALANLEVKIYKAVKNFTLASLGRPALDIIADRLDLTEFVDYFFEHNKSTAEYHSNYHAICVALNSYEGAMYHDMSYRDTRGLVLGSLFHDFDHTGGNRNDTANIKLAVDGLTSAYLSMPKTTIDYTELQHVIYVLNITKYPYEKTPVLLAEKIIRDADLMQPYEPDLELLGIQYEGLRTEINRTYASNSEAPFEKLEFAKGQKDWLDTYVEWHSDWAKAKTVQFNWELTKQRLFDTMSKS